jgi:hypothetical protein
MMIHRFPEKSGTVFIIILSALNDCPSGSMAFLHDGLKLRKGYATFYLRLFALL